MAQATSGGQAQLAPKTDQETLDFAVALFDVVRLTRRTRHTDAIEPAGVAVLATVERLRPARPSDVACELHLDLSTISRHLSKLEEDGYLQRTEDPDDRRARRVEPTPHGREVLFDVLANRAATLNEALSHWSENDRQTLTKLLSNLARDLEAAQ